MVQLLDPIDELATLLDRNASQFTDALLAVQRARLKGDKAGVNRSFDKLQTLISQTMALADMMGRRRVLLEVRAAESEAKMASTPVVPKVPFVDAIDDLASRYPELAATAAEVTDVYRFKHGFALAKSADLHVTERIQLAMDNFLKVGVAAPAASMVIQEIGGFTQAYADTVYRTNTHTAYSAGRFRAASDPDVKRIMPALKFMATPDADVRRGRKQDHKEDHLAANGIIAPVEHEVWTRLAPPLGYNCFLPDTVVNGIFTAGVRSRYSGPAFEIQTRKGSRFRVTGNHPVATATGLKPAKCLTVGEDCLTDQREIERLSKLGGSLSLELSTDLGAPNDQDVPASAEDVFESLGVQRAAPSSAFRTRVTPVDLHGDAVFVEGEVDVVWADGFLPPHGDSILHESVEQFGLMESGAFASASHSLGGLDPLGQGLLATSGSFPSGTTLALDSGPVVGAGLATLPLQEFGGSSPSGLDVMLPEDASERPAAYSKFLREMQQAFPTNVAFDEIVSIRQFDFTGHVYDLQTQNGWILAHGTVTSNCRCSLRLVSKFEIERKNISVPHFPAGWRKAKPHPGFGHRPDLAMYGG